VNAMGISSTAVLIIAQGAGAGGTAAAGGVFLLLLLALYFVPAMVAGARGHQNTAAIFMLNLFLGWTMLGWVIALVWAFTAVEKKKA